MKKIKPGIKVSTSGGVDLTTGLVSVWELDEISGTNVVDSAGNHNGTLNNVTINQSGKINKSYLFTATTSYIVLPDNTDFSFGNAVTDNAFTWSFWFNLASDSRSYLSSKLTEYLFYYESTTNEFIFKLGDGSTSTNYLEAKIPFTDYGTWTHLVLTYDGLGSHTGLKIYKNGSLTSSTNKTQGTYVATHNSSQSLYIGNYNTNSAYLHGNLDQTAVWKDVEFSLEQVQALNNLNNGLAYSNW